MGEIRQRGKVYWIRYYYYRNGRRYEESSHSTKKGAAVDLLKIREGDVAKGIPVTAKVGQLRVEEAFVAVVNDYKVNVKRSLVDVERRINLHLEPLLRRPAHGRDHLGRRRRLHGEASRIRRSPGVRQQRARDPEAGVPPCRAFPHGSGAAIHSDARGEQRAQGFAEADQVADVLKHLPRPSGP